jgi:hypothetical protein
MPTVNLPRRTSRSAVLVVGLLFSLVAGGTLPAAAEQQTSKTQQPPVTPEVQWNRDLLQSGRIEQMAGSMAQANKAAEQAANKAILDRVRSTLPSMYQSGVFLKFDGTYVSVSKRGPEAINLIRQVPVRTGKERNEVLTRLLNLSRDGVPEALNFSGFVYEYGLFGAPHDLGLARSHYEAAAARHYQPAIFNLATLAYFGRGQPSNPEAARVLIHQAVSIGSEASNRVCGLATFIEYRSGDRDSAARFGKSCYSPLANIPNAAYNNQMPLDRRIKLLRDSIATGAPDGYRWLEEITQRAGPDKAQLYCKYRLVNRLRTASGSLDIKALARTCYDTSTADADRKSTDNVVQGITSFVLAETRALDQLRRNDRFHHAWSVPYLPFAQSDADLYATVMKDAK